MTDEAMPAEEELHQLEDIDVLTVGLVDAGANGEDFYLLKRADAVTDDTTTHPEPTTLQVGEVGDGFWARVKGVFVDALQEGTQHEDAAEEASKMVDNKPQVPEVPVPDTPEEVAPVTPDPEPVEMQKSQPVTGKAHDELLGRMAALEKSRDELVIELRKAQAVIEEERGRNELIKAQAFAKGLQSVPVKPDELGEQVHFLRKTAPDRAEFWEGLLKATDNALATAGLFSEFGTSQEPEVETPVGSVVKAVTEADDPKAALLDMNPADAAAYLKARRKELREA